MKKILILIACLNLIVGIGTQKSAIADAHQVHNQWHQWRGPDATGVAPHATPPTEWSENKNIRWKTEIPGRGHASPIIWENTIFVTTAIKTDEEISSEALQATENQLPAWRRSAGTAVTHVLQFVVLSIDRQTGEIRWQRVAKKALPHEGTFGSASWASSSPITDGRHVFVYFGSFGLYCYDFDGKLKWQTDLGDMDIFLDFGEGSSPALYGETLVINWDHQGQSFVVALDKKTGAEKWRTNRDEMTTWTTPIVVKPDDTPQVITSANNRTRGYDLLTGTQIWEAGGLSKNTIPSPVFANGIVYVASGYDGEVVQAIQVTGSKGDITDTKAIVWSQDKDAPYVPSLLLYDNTLYALKSHKAILSCFNAETGNRYYGPKRLSNIKGIYASPVGANGKIYLVGRDGNAAVIKHGTKFEILAENHLDDHFDASPAIIDQELYLRGHKHLYCIAE
jgi:outer membrane protein assembly factor BamB